MAVSNKIRSILQLTGKKHADLADYLGISKQSLSNKYSRESFSVIELIEIANFVGGELSVSCDSGTVTFNLSDADESRERKEQQKR